MPGEVPLTELLDILRETDEPCRQVGAVEVVVVVVVVIVLTVIVLLPDRAPRRNAEVEVKLLESAVCKEEEVELLELEELE